ncbi:MAG: hypothetical protein ABFD96_20960 [Armatimonadia bacterium]
MPCRKYQYLIGTEKAEKLAENEPLQAHLRECTECAQLAREMQQLAGILRGLDVLEAPETLGQRVSTRVAASPPSPRSWWQRLRDALGGPAPVLQPRQALAAAGLIVLVVALLAVVFHQPSASTPVTAVPALASPAGSQPISYPEGRPDSGAAPGATGSTDRTTK